MSYIHKQIVHDISSLGSLDILPTHS